MKHVFLVFWVMMQLGCGSGESLGNQEKGHEENIRICDEDLIGYHRKVAFHISHVWSDADVKKLQTYCLQICDGEKLVKSKKCKPKITPCKVSGENQTPNGILSFDEFVDACEKVASV